MSDPADRDRTAGTSRSSAATDERASQKQCWTWSPALHVTRWPLGLRHCGMPSRSGPVAALAGAVVVWGTTFVVSDAALRSMSPAVLTVARFVLALVVLVPLAVRRGGTRSAEPLVRLRNSAGWWITRSPASRVRSCSRSSSEPLPAVRVHHAVSSVSVGACRRAIRTYPRRPRSSSVAVRCW